MGLRYLAENPKIANITNVIAAPKTNMPCSLPSLIEIAETAAASATITPNVINTFQITNQTPLGLLSPISCELFIISKKAMYAIGSSIAPNTDAMIMSQVFETPPQKSG